MGCVKANGEVCCPVKRLSWSLMPFILASHRGVLLPLVLLCLHFLFFTHPGVSAAESCLAPTAYDLSLRLCQVNPQHLGVLSAWNPAYTLETVLMELRKDMASQANRKMPQPQPDTTYPHC